MFHTIPIRFFTNKNLQMRNVKTITFKIVSIAYDF